MLNLTTEHAIRALLYLAQRPLGEAVSADRIAQALGAPANYMGKTLNQLARRGVLSSTRGPSGGFRLARPASEITVAEVAEVYAEPRARAVCLLGGRPCSERTPCRVHAQWTALTDEVATPLRTTTIADLLGMKDEQDDTGLTAGHVTPAA